MDYATLMAMIAYWNQTGQDPFGLTQADTPIPFLSPEDSGDIGTQDYYNNRLTFEGKANDYFMDPATTLRLGTSTGGISRESVAPTRTYEPVQMGATSDAVIGNWEMSGDPIQEIAADVMRRFPGANKLTIDREIRAAYTSPDSDYGYLHERLVSDPRLTWENTSTGNKELDAKYLDSALTYLQGEYDKTQSSSPAVGASGGTAMSGAVPFDTSGAGFTDGTVVGTEDGGQYRQGADGNWYIMREEASPTTEALREAGFEGDPFGTYDPEMLVSPQVGAQRDRVGQMAQTQNAGSFAAREMAARKKLQEQQSLAALLLKAENPATPEDYPDSGFRENNEFTFGMNRIGDSGASIPWFQRRERTTGSIGDISALQETRQLPSGPRIPTRRGNAGASPAERADWDARAAQRQLGLIERQRTARQRDQEMLQRRAENRQLVMNMLQQSGHDPFQDWNRARQSNIYGG
jgi:hypothetical protein